MDFANRFLKAGDMLRFERSEQAYTHWGIYDGQGYVIHVTGDAANDMFWEFLQTFQAATHAINAFVKREELSFVAAGSKFYVDNYMDTERTPYVQGTIVERAISRVGKAWVYNLLQNNCEHFATNMRYGRPISRQAARGTELIQASGAGFGAGAAIVAASFIASRYS
ncbi:phospholipase A and acyltransferase 3-like [Hydractinia symbiolongicarpus]|uniref:phospholipase A and acyltransferase 3-like n=1 Tax=Hydractinia symbiolongicarpus TaxID=13093 RepID=UPI00254F7A67|nr:phospholipase A and acyltransferase 3-like [Hydractinia symbiolongicarpus]XP_057316557.1 phospholipase A and acyltransferase 3-like [Hydractinia symbiolongicarpus]